MIGTPALVPHTQRLFIVRRSVHAARVARERFVPNGIRRFAELQRQAGGQLAIAKQGQAREPDLLGISLGASSADDADLMGADGDPLVPMSTANCPWKGRRVELGVRSRDNTSQGIQS